MPRSCAAWWTTTRTSLGSTARSRHPGGSQSATAFASAGRVSKITTEARRTRRSKGAATHEKSKTPCPPRLPGDLKIRLGDVDAGADAELVKMRCEPLLGRGAAEVEEIVEELGIGVELA